MPLTRRSNAAPRCASPKGWAARSPAGRSPSVSSTTATSRDRPRSPRRRAARDCLGGDRGECAEPSPADQYPQRRHRRAAGVLGAAAIDQSRPGMEITVQMSFRRDGELLGHPRITFESAGASDDDRLAYRIAVAKMLKRCTPLPFTDALGNAIAGRPFTMRLIANRKLKQAEYIP